jgi:uncharacterized protein YfbU (UPF0304 family)
MPVVTVRVDDATRDALEQLARGHSAGVSGLLRGQIDVLLGRQPGERQPDHPLSLGTVERRMLMLQHETLAALSTDAHDRQHHLERATVLGAGYVGEYGDEFAAMEPELSQADCAVVWDILDMFSVLEASVEQLAPGQLDGLGERAEWSLRFRGFDGQDSKETRYLSYARFLVETERWPNLADRFDSAHRWGNSHAPFLHSYLRMLDAFRPVWRARLASGGHAPEQLRLTPDELGPVLAASTS